MECFIFFLSLGNQIEHYNPDTEHRLWIQWFLLYRAIKQSTNSQPNGLFSQALVLMSQIACITGKSSNLGLGSALQIPIIE